MYYNISDVVHKEVIIIGNGPSGIAMSYFLAGNVPYLKSDDHPDEMLSARLRQSLGRPLLEENLMELAHGLEGRSTNPISLLLDSLQHPCADLGMDLEPLIEYRKTGIEIDHLVLGKGPPGGSWHKMDPDVLTLSLGSWMALPGLGFHCFDSPEQRALAKTVARYYENYVEIKGLKRFFCTDLQVVEVHTKACLPAIPSIDRHTCFISMALNKILLKTNHRKTKNRCKRPLEEDLNKRKKVFESELRRRPIYYVEAVNTETGERTTYSCNYLVLANGASDLPNRLEISRRQEGPDWLVHDLRSLEQKLTEFLRQNRDDDGMLDPVLVVGAGLSAADAVIAMRTRGIPVAHVFRNKSADLNKQLPENMYPEYHEVHQMMQDEGANHTNYSAFPEYSLTEFNEHNRSVILTSKTGESVKLHVSFVAVLIGSRPDLSFLPHSQSLAVNQRLPIDCKTNTIFVDKSTHLVRGCDNLFAIGPLAGDNFVRFLPGGALAVAAEINRQIMADIY